jgi:hypothetical protein
MQAPVSLTIRTNQQDSGAKGVQEGPFPVRVGGPRHPVLAPFPPRFRAISTSKSGVSAPISGHFDLDSWVRSGFVSSSRSGRRTIRLWQSDRTPRILPVLEATKPSRDSPMTELDSIARFIDTWSRTGAAERCNGAAGPSCLIPNHFRLPYPLSKLVDISWPRGLFPLPVRLLPAYPRTIALPEGDKLHRLLAGRAGWSLFSLHRLLA